MPTDRPVAEAWLRKLDKALTERQLTLASLNDYYVGNHPLAFSSAKFRRAFGGLFASFADNWMQIVVDAVEERLNVEGFRLGDDASGDREAWQVWQRNQLDADSQIAHTEALVYGESFVLVWADDDGAPEVTVESPLEAIVARRAGKRRERAAGLKRWVADDGHEWATLYLPDSIWKWRASKPAGGMLYTGTMPDAARWEPREVEGEPWPLPNVLGVVPLVPLPNRPRIDGQGLSEIANVTPTQDAVNKLVADMLVASEFAAFRQRWATGIDIPVDPETEQAVEPFKTAIDRLFVSENADARFGEFQATDLGNYVGAVEMLVQHIASQTRTPPHYFYLSGQFPSGESIKSAEAGLTAKARRKMRHFGEGWEEVMRLALLIANPARDRAPLVQMETIWADPEFRSEGEHVDAVMKMQALGVPQQQLWEELGFSPQQISRFRQMQWEDVLVPSGNGAAPAAAAMLPAAGMLPAAMLPAAGQ